MRMEYMTDRSFVVSIIHSYDWYVSMYTMKKIWSSKAVARLDLVKSDRERELDVNKKKWERWQLLRRTQSKEKAREYEEAFFMILESR